MKAYRLPALFMMLILLLPVVTAQDGAPIIIEPNPQTEVQPIGPMNQAPAPAANPVQSADTQPAPASMSAPMSEPANPNSAVMDAPFSNSAPSSSHTVETDMRAINLDSTPGFEVGEQFELEVHFRDAATADAVFSGYADFVYDDTYLQVDSITYDPDYSYLQLGTIGSGVVNDMGATSGSLTPVADTLVVTINLTVLQSGNTGINLASPSDVYAETTIYGSDNDQRANTDFASETLFLGALSNLIPNGDFSNGRTNWAFNGQFSFTVVNEQLNFWRDYPGFRGARAFQNFSNGSAVANQPISLSVDLENTSAVPKGVKMLLINSDLPREFFGCGVTLAPGQAVTTMSLEGITPSAWTNMRVVFFLNDPDDTRGLLIDNVFVTNNPNQPAGTRCTGQSAAANTELLVNGDFSQDAFGAPLYWTRQGGGSSVLQLVNGEMHYQQTINTPSDRIALFNRMMHNMPAGSPFEASLQVANDSSTNKVLQVVVRDFGSPQFSICFFDIPGNTPLTEIRVRDVTADLWGNPGMIVRMISSNDTMPLRIDNVSMTHIPTLNTSTQCSSDSPVTPNGNAVNNTPGIDADTTKPAVPLPEANSELPAIPANPSDNPAVNPVNPNPDGGMPSVPGF